MRTKPPPSLLSLTIDSAVLNLSDISDLSSIPDHILLDLFLRILRAGKLTEKVLRLFIATGKDEVISLVEALNIRHVLTPVLPTTVINDNEVDIVIGALHADLTTFMNEWRPIFSRFHLIIVKDPDLKEELQIPEGFRADVYSKADIERVVGSSSSIRFSGYSCRYFGFLISRKKYVVCIDDDCVPAKDNAGYLVDAVAQHVSNLQTPATPFFFNTLYDPFRKGADFVRGYPFSLREGVNCAVSCGLWLNMADLDAPTQALKPRQKNVRYVDAVLTVPARALLPMSGINVAFNREAIGPAIGPALRLTGEGKLRWETVEDIWCGMCVKVICDHLGLGVKTGLPYVWRTERGDAVQSLKKEWEGVKLMEDVVPFFQSLKLPQSATTAEVCMVEIAKAVNEQLGKAHPVFSQAAETMVEWVKLWKTVASG
ncbi:probable UDP-arabinopyranose mutase 5 isoform X3 [Vigna umbellata]|uniref:probable UDP-arabinopyranose mutase 5 isoform X2 n=1 Tax=Phaseolus angularis TaxID=3914 RepID=UPI00080A7736|nr:probable UDP-arabinopyranose mutase 5 isoform X2 [Vigna angularis]XP_047164464.1 probable UDP-arabinopyranose mutase 5 isoform X3 [Vigna umbellata]